LLGQIVAAGKAQGMTASEIAVRAGLASTTISRMKSRRSGDFGAIERMAAVVGLQFTLAPAASIAARVASGSFFD